MISTTLFNLGTALYATSAYLYLVEVLTKRRWNRRWPTWLLLSSIILLGGAMVGRTLEYGFPFLTLREVLSVYIWVLAVAYVVLEWHFGYTVLGAMITPVGTLIILIASLLPSAQDPLLALLQSSWLMAHVSTFFAAYAAFTLAFASALAYLLQERALRRKRLARHLPPLLVMDNLGRWLVLVGLVLMTAALFIGSAWAEQTWGTPWVWEPKQVLILVTIGIYGLYLLLRHVFHWSGRRAAWLVVVGFIAMLTTFLGADLLTSGELHNYLF